MCLCLWTLSTSKQPTSIVGCKVDAITSRCQLITQFFTGRLLPQPRSPTRNLQTPHLRDEKRMLSTMKYGSSERKKHGSRQGSVIDHSVKPQPCRRPLRLISIEKLMGQPSASTGVPTVGSRSQSMDNSLARYSGHGVSHMELPKRAAYSYSLGTKNES